MNITECFKEGMSVYFKNEEKTYKNIDDFIKGVALHVANEIDINSAIDKCEFFKSSPLFAHKVELDKSYFNRVVNAPDLVPDELVDAMKQFNSSLYDYWKPTGYCPDLNMPLSLNYELRDKIKTGITNLFSGKHERIVTEDVEFILEVLARLIYEHLSIIESGIKTIMANFSSDDLEMIYHHLWASKYSSVNPILSATLSELCNEKLNNVSE